MVINLELEDFLLDIKSIIIEYRRFERKLNFTINYSNNINLNFLVKITLLNLNFKILLISTTAQRISYYI